MDGIADETCRRGCLGWPGNQPTRSTVPVKTTSATPVETESWVGYGAEQQYEPRLALPIC